MARTDFRQARCVVTGASSGLGRALAAHLLEQGASVVLNGRSVERLEGLVQEMFQRRVPRERMLVVAADLTDPAGRERLVDGAGQFLGGALDLLVNCAGVGAYGRFVSHPPGLLEELLAINVVAAAELSRACHALLCRGEDPWLVNIGSIVARRGLPGRALYSASKFALAGLTESIRAEWSYDGIRVLLVNPGFTDTAFEDNLLVDTAFMKTKERRHLRPDQVAARVIGAIRRGRREVTLSASGRTLLLVNRWFPWVVDWGMGRWTRRLYRRYLLPPRHAARVVPPGPRAYNARVERSSGD